MTGRGHKGPVLSVGLIPESPRVVPTTAEVGKVALVPDDSNRVGGLVLSRHLGQSIMIGDSVEVEIAGIKSGTVRLRIVAPREVPVHRREIYEAIRSDPRHETPGPMPDGETSARPDPTRSGSGGLVLSRHPGESIMIGDRVAIEVVDLRPSTVRLRVAAPREIAVHRREIYDAIREAP